MPIYAVTYDLNKEKNYQKLWDEFDRLGGHRVARSFYLLNLTNNDSVNVLDHFKNFVDADDTLVVVKTKSSDIAMYKPMTGSFAWVKDKS